MRRYGNYLPGGGRKRLLRTRRRPGRRSPLGRRAFSRRRRVIVLLRLGRRSLLGRRPFLTLAAAVFGILALVGVIKINAIRTALSTADAVSGRTVVIDPGHGGPDPGAIGPSGLMEKDVVLDVGLKLAALFNRVGCYTILTREEDVHLGDSRDPDSFYKRLDLERRAELANKSRADIFISVHANSFPEAVWSGAQTFYHSGSRESRGLAEAIQKELSLRLGPNLRLSRPGDHYYVLRNTRMPSVIVEVGFISNPREEALLGRPEYRKKLAEAIFYGTVNYLVRRHSQERRGSGGEKLKPRADSHPILPTLTINADEVILYFCGPTNFDDSLVPEVRKLPPGSEGVALERKLHVILSELIRGPANGSVLCRTIPSGTRVRSVWVFEGVAYVDFSKELSRNYWGGSRSEALTIYSIVNTVTEVSGIRKVKIFIEGKEGETIAGHILLDEPFERDMSVVRGAPSGRPS